VHEGLVNSYKNHYLPLQKPSVGRILLESIDASASAGIGIGFKAEIVNVGIGAVAKRVITVQQSKADIWAGTQDKISASASAGPAKTSYTLQDWQHEFSDECICWEWDNEGKTCPAWRKRKTSYTPDGKDLSHSFNIISFGAYFLVGVDASVSINLDYLMEELDRYYID